MNGVKFTVMLEGFSTPFVFEVDSERVESVKRELGKGQGWSKIQYLDGAGNAIDASKIVAFYWEPLIEHEGTFTNGSNVESRL
jgi:hypothetical protein